MDDYLQSLISWRFLYDYHQPEKESLLSNIYKNEYVYIYYYIIL